MAIILTLIIRYTNDIKTGYIFRENENIPPYIFMSIVIALFVGLSVSAEEIFRDRKILKRERFLNLSRSSYLLSKVAILFALSAIQTVIYVLIGNSVVEIKGLSFEYWVMLFSISCFANILGLNISSAFNSAVTIYILIPLLVIPQMALGGAMFNFDKINKVFGGGKNNAPVIADVMASRWAYEGLAVAQFKNNRFERKFYDIEQIESFANYKQVYYIPKLQTILDETTALSYSDAGKSEKQFAQNLSLLANELRPEIERFSDIAPVDLSSLKPGSFDPVVSTIVSDYLKKLNDKYITIYNVANRKKNTLIKEEQDNMGGEPNYMKFSDKYYNDFLADIVKKTTAKNKILRSGDSIIQLYEPVYQYPEKSVFSFRAHFFAPYKYIFGMQVDTFYFNLIVIWLMSVLFYITLYFDLLKKSLEIGEKHRSAPKSVA